MTTPHQPVDEIDDIIELTDIIEEGTLPTPHAASPEKAVDAKSLDNELDALLNDIVPTETSSLDPDDDFDLDALFATDPAQTPQTAPADQDISQAETMPVPGSEVDLSELDELFDALKTSSNDLTEENALDALLLGDGPEPEPMPQSPATAPDAAPDIPTDISADISAESALDADTKEPAAAALSADDLDLDLHLTGLDESVDLPSAPAPANELHAAENAENLTLPEPDKSGPALQDADADLAPVKDMLIEEISNDLDLPGLVDAPHQTAPPTAQEAARSAEPQTNVEQTVTDTATVNADQQAVARMSLEMDHLSSRVDALEVWKDQPAQPVASPEDVDSLREQLATALARLEALEARPVLSAEELSASLMSTFTAQQDAALDIVRQDSANLAERLDQAHAQPVPSPEDVDALREQLATALARLEALEDRPVLNAEELSASLMSTFTAQQDAALDILRQDSANLAERLDQAHAQPVASPEDVDALREQLATALARLEALEARPVLNA
ncbi:MAG: hypothetical protein GX055_10860, partial [Desulfovibrionales bacterium]|nr:hypothetical protein [Desulfovibrionales bacterium]